jgi:hypothetical protein
LALSVVAVLASTGFALYSLPGEAERCVSRWKDSGTQSRYENYIGCKVQRKDGTWVMERYLRVER